MRRRNLPIIFIKATDVEGGSMPKNQNIRFVNLHSLKLIICFHDNGWRIASLYSLYGMGSDR